MNRAKYIVRLIEKTDPKWGDVSVIEPGGKWYQARLDLEDILKEAGLKGKIHPSDDRYGPMAELIGRPGQLNYFVDQPSKEFSFSSPYVKQKGWAKGGVDFQGNKEEMISFLLRYKRGQV